jgi:hypothetical protein
MRVWLEILREQHPGVSWVATEQEPATSSDTEAAASGDLAAAA